MDGDFTIGGVIGRAGRLVRENFGSVLLLGLLLPALPQALLIILAARYARILASNGTPPNLRGTIGGLTGFLVMYVVGTVLQGGLIDRLTRQPSVASSAGLGTSLATGCRLFLPNLGIGILTGLGTFLGGILLVIPGLMLLCRWSVSVAAEVVERTGVLGSMRRSRNLTEGYRWRIFSIVLICSVGAVLLAAGQFISARVLAGAGAGATVLLLFSEVVAPLVNTVNALLFTIAYVGIYLELRRVKEGGTLSEIASVFT